MDVGICRENENRTGFPLGPHPVEVSKLGGTPDAGFSGLGQGAGAPREREKARKQRAR